MSDINMDKAFHSMGESIHDLFDQIGEGFFVPLYQREYTWEEENIDQLFDDIISGVSELVDEDGTQTTTFLGTAILTELVDKRDAVKPGEYKAQPTAVKLVIDGQQRIATIALISIQITELLKELRAQIPDDTPKSVPAAITKHCNELIGKLRHLHALRLGRGASPLYKPKVIRAADDKWNFDGDDSSYGSPVTRYIANYIRTNDPGMAFGSVNTVDGARVRRNVKLIDTWLLNISISHVPDTPLHGQFPAGEVIVTDRIQKYILRSSDATVRSAISGDRTIDELGKDNVIAIYNVFLFTYYLLRRCGVNRLQPTREEWGFDMFQALNSTGTPLTVLETFVPQVMRAEHMARNNWHRTPSKESLDDIEELFESTKSNEQKNRRTNELVRAVGLCYEGTQLGNKFSKQRKWLTTVYEREQSSLHQKREFLANVARVADFFFSAWYMEDEHRPHLIRCVENHRQGPLASFLVQYLRDARSFLSAPILSRFYSQLQSDDSAAVDEFVESVKACAAFFTLWRSANSTSGLDDIYRRFFSRHKEAHCWNTGQGTLSAQKLKEYFSFALQEKGIGDKDSWIAASERFLLYTEVKEICRFVLFVAGHDQVPDYQNPGLTVKGNAGVCDLLNLNQWKARDYKTLEHVAPQRPPAAHSWDQEIYFDNKFHDIGNLLLLPKDINEFVDNKEWPVKFFHYCHVGSRSEEEITSFDNKAQRKGIAISQKAIKALSVAKFSCVVEPLLELGENGFWDAELIDRRTNQIKEITWDTLNSWLKT